MKQILPLFFLVLLLGCKAETDTDILMVEKYWSSIKNNDVTALKDLISKSEYSKAYGKDSGFSGFSLVADIKVGKKLKNGNVETIFKTFCYPEYSIETVIKQSEGEKIIDGHATFSEMMKKTMKNKPLKKYCYSFKDQKLSGKIAGQNIILNFVNKEIFDFGTHKKVTFELTTKNCKSNECNKPKLLIDNLNLESEGGNFNNKENITLFDPVTNHNEIVTTGSYKVDSTINDKTKLYISFEKDKNNFINGYIELENK